MVLPEKLVEQVQAAYPSLTNSEKLVAQYLIESPEDFAMSSARRTADAVGVSEASVTRFAYALGYNRFSNLRESLQKELLGRNSRGFKDQLHASYKGSTGAERQVHDYLKEDIELLERCLTTINADAFEKAVQAVVEAKTITVTGARRARGLAVILAITLNNMLGNTRLASTYSGELADELKRLSPDDLLVAFSFARYARDTVTMVQLARHKGVPSIVITDSPLAPAARAATITLTVETHQKAHMDSYVAALSVANALAATVAFRYWETSEQHLSDLEDLFLETETFWDNA